MVRRLFFIVLIAMTSIIASAQQTSRQSNITGMQVLGQAVAAEFGKWEAPVLTQVSATGVHTVNVEGSAFVVQQGQGFMPLTITNPIRIVDGANSETVTPSAVNCSQGSGTCTFTANFNSTHKNNYRIRTATYGLQEAIEFMHARGGQVLVTSDWNGLTSTITDVVTGWDNVSIFDSRGGANNWYAWDSNSYALVIGWTSDGIAIGSTSFFYGATAFGTHDGVVTAVSPVASLDNGSSDAAFRVSANVMTTSGAGYNFNIFVSYTDPAGNPHTDKLPMSSDGTFVSSVVDSNTPPAVYSGAQVHVRVKGNTNINVYTNGTFGSVLYNVQASIQELK